MRAEHRRAVAVERCARQRKHPASRDESHDWLELESRLHERLPGFDPASSSMGRTMPKSSETFLDIADQLQLRVFCAKSGVLSLVGSQLLRQRIDGLRSRPAFARRKPGVAVVAALRAPGSEMRGVQAFSAQQRSQLSPFRAACSFLEDFNFLFCIETTSCRCAHHLGLRDQGYALVIFHEDFSVRPGSVNSGAQVVSLTLADRGWGPARRAMTCSTCTESVRGAL